MTEPEKKPRLFTMPWFAPLYRRIILVAIIALWTCWEWFGNRDQFWGLITLAALAYAVWSFFINFDKELEKFEAGERNGKPPTKP